MSEPSAATNNRNLTEEALLALNAELEQRVAERTAELERALREQRRLAAIIEATTDYVGIADTEGWSLYINKNGRRMVGKADEDTERWHVARCHPQREHEKLQKMFADGLQGNVWSGETALLHRDGTEFPVLMLTIPLRDENGKIESIAAVMRDISERKRFEEELRQAKEAAEAALEQSRRLIEIIDFSPDLIGTATLDGKITYFNQSVERVMGIEEGDDTSDLNFTHLYTPEALETLMTTAIPYAIDHGSWIGELDIFNHRGERIPVSLVGLVHRSSDGKPQYLSGVMRDISERKRFEAELQQAKESAEAALEQSRRLTSIIEATSDIVGMADMHGRMIYVNQAGRASYGLTPDEDITTFDMSRFYPPHVMDLVLNELLPMALREGLWAGENTVLNRAGEEIPVSQVGLILRNERGEPEAMATILRDISQQKRVEAELQQAKDAAEAALAESKRLISIIEATSDIIGMANLQGRMTYLNKSGREIYGISSDADLTQYGLDYFYPPHVLEEIQTVHLPIAMREGLWFGENTTFNHAREEIPVSQVGLVLRNERGEPEALATIMRDISQQKRVEAELQQAKEAAEEALEESKLLTAIIESSPDMIGITDMEGNWVYMNRASRCRLGIPDDEDVTRVNMRESFIPDEIEAVLKESIPAMMATGTWEGEVISVSRTGEQFPVSIVSVMHFAPDGTPQYLSGVSRDITERKRFEEELRQAKEAAEAALAESQRLTALIEASPDIVAIADMSGHLIYLNSTGRKKLGLDENKAVSEYDMRNFLQPDMLTFVEQEVITTLLEKDSWVGELIFTNPSSSMQYTVSHVGLLHRAPDGKPQYMSGVSRDIAERKRFEEELRQAKDAAESALAESQRLSAIIQTSPDIIAIADMTGKMIYLNQMGRDKLGVAQDEDITAYHMMQFCSTDSQPLVAHQVIPGLLSNGLWIGEMAMVHLTSGGRYPVSLSAMLHRAPDGTPQYMSGVSRDMTERIRFESELRQAKEAAEAALAESQRLVAIIESSSDLIGIADMEGRYTYLNGTARRKLGLTEDEPLDNAQVSSFFTPESVDTIFNVGMPIAMEQGSWTGEVITVPRNGEPFPVSLVGIVHRNPDGTPAFMSGSSRDISESKRTQLELQQAKEAAEAASRAKSTFLANMSHEIRTPMNAIIGMTSLLLDMPLQAKQRDFVETIRTSGDTLLTIINDILDFSKIEAEKMDLVYRPFDLVKCIESALDLLAPRAAEKGLDLVYVLDENVPTAVVGDTTRLRQILVNLLGNAIKFTAVGEVVVSVTSKPCDVEDCCYLHFAVRDTGIGIPKDKLDRLFKPFSQVDASMTREYGGTGLGLAISKRLSEMMDGSMWVESEGLPGRGSTFHFTVVVEMAREPVGSLWQMQQPHLQGRRALIVDDNPTNRRILSLQMQNWGMDVQEAALPGEALTILRTDRAYDVAVVDMLMPEMNGDALGDAIRLLPHRADLPLLMLTSLSQQVSNPDVFAAFLTKPVKPSELYNALVVLFAGETQEIPVLPEPSTDTPLAERLPLRILLAEDVVVNQKFAIHALERMGYRVDVVANGLEVLGALQRQPYEVILMDVQMPEMDGLEATRRLRQMPIVQPRVIAMTANAMQGDREICLQAGMDDYISKPVYIHELRAALERAGKQVSKKQRHAVIETSPALDPELAAAFAEEAPMILAELRVAIERRDAKAIRAAAHKLKGSSGYVGADTLHQLSAALETRGREGNLDDTPSLLAQLSAELESVLLRLYV